MKQNEVSEHILKSFEKQKLVLKQFEDETIADIKHNLIKYPGNQNYFVYSIAHDFETGTYRRTIRSFDFTRAAPSPLRISTILHKYISTLNQNTLMVISTVPLVEMTNMITNEKGIGAIVSVQTKMMLYPYIVSFPENRPADITVSPDIDIHPELFILMSQFVNILQTN